MPSCFALYLDCGRIVISVVWLVHIIIFMLVTPPIKPFLNDFFIRLDKAWGMFLNNDQVIWALNIHCNVQWHGSLTLYPSFAFLRIFFSCLSLLDIVVSVVICNHLSLCCKLMTYQHIWWILDVSDACLAVVAFQGY